MWVIENMDTGEIVNVSGLAADLEPHSCDVQYDLYDYALGKWPGANVNVYDDEEQG